MTSEISLGSKKVSFANEPVVLGGRGSLTDQPGTKDSDADSTTSNVSQGSAGSIVPGRSQENEGNGTGNVNTKIGNDDVAKNGMIDDDKRQTDKPTVSNNNAQSDEITNKNGHSRGFPAKNEPVLGLPPRVPQGKPPASTKMKTGPSKPEEVPPKMTLTILPEEEKMKVVIEQTTKEALEKFEAAAKKPASECSEINLCGLYPAIVSMDTTLGKCSLCERLSLSLNKISVIENLSGMRSLKILSLGRNRISSLTGLADVAQSLRELRISFNAISTLDGIEALQQLQVLQMAYNRVELWSEFCKLSGLERLQTLHFKGNPVEQQYISEGAYKWRFEVSKVLRGLKVLDNVPLVKSQTSEGGGGGTLQDLEIPDIINTY